MTKSAARLHKLDLERLGWQWERRGKRIAESRRMLTEGSGDPERCQMGIVDDSLELAGLAIIFERGDGVARRHLDDAATAAREWLKAPSKDDRNPPAAGGGGRGWDIGNFVTVLDTLVAFGTRDGAREAAGVPDSDYRNPAVVAEAAFFAAVAAEQQWIRGDDAAALERSRSAAKTNQNPLTARAKAIGALVGDDERGFRTALADYLVAHRAIYSKKPLEAVGAYSLGGLAFARMARTCGWEVEEALYLPVRFLAPGPVR